MIYPIGQQYTVGELLEALAGLDPMTPVTIDGDPVAYVDPTSAEVWIGSTAPGADPDAGERGWGDIMTGLATTRARGVRLPRQR